MVGYGSPHVSQAQIKAQQKAFQDEARETYQEGLKEHHSDVLRYQCENASYPIQTKFTDMDLDTMKSMIASVNPGGVQEVATHWQKVHDHLVTGGDSAHSQLKLAVDNVMEHWEGESANQFRRHADKILGQISNTATHAHTVSAALHQTSQDIDKAKSKLDSMENPGWLSSAWDSLTDSGREDKYTKEDIEAKRLPPDVLAQVEEGYMSEQDETNLKAANVMETLARSYVGTTRHLRSAPTVDDNHEIPPSNPSIPMPTPIPPFSGSSSTPSTGSPSLKSKNFSTLPKPEDVVQPRHSGITGGAQIPVSKTQIDGLPVGIDGHQTEPLPGGKLPGGGTGPGSPIMKAPIETGGFPGGLPGGKPGGSGGGRLPGGRPGGVRGGIGSGAAEEGRTGGRTGGMRGMHGMGGGGGAGKGGRSISGGRGPLARAKGGVAGAPKGITGGRGPATPGGTGLGRGRGGGASEAGGRGTRGMFAGGMRGTNQRPGEEESEEGTRPDYLVEDEETWTPEDGRSVPRNIE